MKSTAIALQSPFLDAYQSLHNSANALINFMYGTTARANVTMAFALGLAMLGSYLGSSELLPTVCAQ